MPDTFTSSLRIQLMQTGGDSGTWGGIANAQFQKLEAGITGNNGGAIDLTGQTSGSFALSANNGTTDQAGQLLYPFTGTLTADFTVLIPGAVKIGWVSNNTAGSRNVILSVGGSGTTLTVAPGGQWMLFYCDGTNVTSPQIVSSSSTGPITINGAATINGNATVSGNAAIGGSITGGVTSLSSLSVSGTSTLGLVKLAHEANVISATSGTSSIGFGSAGMSINMSNGGSAVITFSDVTQTYGWGYGTGNPMNLTGTGNLSISGTFSQASDRRLKYDINDIDPKQAIEWVMASRPVTYFMRNVPDEPRHWSAGFIAQEQIAAGFPSAYRLVDNPEMEGDWDSPSGKHYVGDATARIAHLTAALQVALRRIDELTERVAALEDEID